MSGLAQPPAPQWLLEGKISSVTFLPPALAEPQRLRYVSPQMALKEHSTHFVKRSSPLGEAEFSGKSHWVPNTDVYVTAEGLIVKVELSGVRSENLQISVEGSQLRISGERPDCCRGGKCTFLVMEINYGAFESVLELPPGYDLSQAKAAYMNGFLRLDVPLAVPAATKPTQIPIGS